MMKVYLAGPMSGIPQFNFPAFYLAADCLRTCGFEVVSPAEMDDKEDAGLAMKSATGAAGEHPNKTWGDFLARDVKLIADGGIEGIVFLPKWENSRGARLEATVGLLCKLKFYRLVHIRRDDIYHVADEMTAFQVSAALHQEVSNAFAQ